MENLENDYRAIPELDRYDTDLLDEGEQSELELEERRRVDQLLAERDEREGRLRTRRHVCVFVCLCACLRACVLCHRSIATHCVQLSSRIHICCA